jgi:IS66 C-terminal element
MYKLIATAKLNNIDPQAWLADALRRTADHPARRLLELSLELAGPDGRTRRRVNITLLLLQTADAAADSTPPVCGLGGC